MALRDTPWANAKRGGGGVLQRLPPSRKGIYSFTHLYIHTHRKRGNVAVAALSQIETAGGGGVDLRRFEGVDRECTSTGELGSGPWECA